MEDQRLYWIWLTLRSRVGTAGQQALLEAFGNPAALWEADEAALERAGLAPALRRALAEKDLAPARAILDRCAEAGVSVVTLTDPAYPSRLRPVENAPILLYCRGALPGESRPIVGLVGSRAADDRALALARSFGREIAACGGLVVTGLAKGIDAHSAQGALEAGGVVLGVLGCGPDVVYPKENAALYARVAERGCLISEYPPGTPPNARHFPARNRLISALSDGVVIVRAAEHSGSLITADCAAAQGRDVFAVPGDPADPLSRGCNALLRDGALAAASGWDVLERYVFRYPDAIHRPCRGAQCAPAEGAAGGMQNAECRMQNEGSGIRDQESGAPTGADKTSPACRGGGPAARPVEGFCPPAVSTLPPIQRDIVAALRDGPLQVDALIDQLGCPASQILPQLTLLQIKHIIRQAPGKIYELA